MRYIIILSIFLIAGCSEKIDTFSFTNLSDKDIYIKKVDGFSREPVTGYLSSGDNASNIDMASTQTDLCKIYWGFTNDRDGGIPDEYTATECNLSELGSNINAISFTFTKGRAWDVNQFSVE